jgi:hypothetical protein
MKTMERANDSRKVKALVANTGGRSLQRSGVESLILWCELSSANAAPFTMPLDVA